MGVINHHAILFTQAFPELLQGVCVQPYVRRYTPPFDEFEVDCCLVPAGELVIISSVPGPFVFVVIAGEGKLQADSLPDGKRAKEGDVFFVPAYTEVKLSTRGPESMQLYRPGWCKQQVLQLTGASNLWSPGRFFRGFSFRGCHIKWTAL